MNEPFLGEVVLYAFNFAPANWAPCSGQLMAISQNVALFSLIKNTFGGNGEVTFALPDYRSIAPEGLQYCIALEGMVPAPAGPSRPQAVGEIASLPYGFAPALWVECNGDLMDVSSNEPLFQAIGDKFGGDGKINFALPNLVHTAPTPPQYPDPPASTSSQYFIAQEGTSDPVNPFLGEVRLFPFSSPPAGWDTCNGQLLQVEQYQALFSLLGVTFGGDARTTFGLPDLRRAAVPEGLQYCIAVGGTFPSRPPVTEEIEAGPDESISLPDEEQTSNG